MGGGREELEKWKGALRDNLQAKDSERLRKDLDGLQLFLQKAVKGAGLEGVVPPSFSRMPLAKDVKLESLAQRLGGYVGSDIEAICREAAMLALRDNIDAGEVKKKHFDEAVKRVRYSVPKEAVEDYEQIEADLKAKASAKELAPSYVG